MNGFYIQITNNLLLDGHRSRMGLAVWEFMWLLDKVTTVDEEGVGWVLGGKPIHLGDISKDQIVSDATVSVNLSKLVYEGYINIENTGHGLIISINKAKKKFKKLPPFRNPKTRFQENQNQNLGILKPQYIDNTVDITNIDKSIGDVSPKENFGNKEIDEILADFKKHKGHIPADKKPRQVAQNIRQITNTFMKSYKNLFSELRGEELTKKYIYDRFYANLKQKKYIDDIEKLETVKLKLRVYLDDIAEKLQKEKQRKGVYASY